MPEEGFVKQVPAGMTGAGAHLNFANGRDIDDSRGYFFEHGCQCGQGLSIDLRRQGGLYAADREQEQGQYQSVQGVVWYGHGVVCLEVAGRSMSVQIGPDYRLPGRKDAPVAAGCADRSRGRAAMR